MRSWPPHLLALAVALLPSGTFGVFEWSYRDFFRWKTKGQCALPDQSPIDIATAQALEDPSLEPLVFSSRRSVVQALLRANTHTWQVSWPQEEGAQAKVTVGGKDYFLKQFHYRSPSENTIDGRYYAMETQLVHQSIDGQLLVVSVMMDIAGEANPYLNWYLWGKFPERSSTKLEMSEVATPYDDFLPKNKSYFRWVGSLTTPPCTTNTTWILLQTPVNISSQQLTQYRTSINSIPRNQLYIDTTFTPSGLQNWDPTLGINIRPTQPLGQRRVARHTAVAIATEADHVTRHAGWLILLLGLLVGLACLCCGVCIYACCLADKGDGWSWHKLSNDRRSISRANSAASSPRGGASDDEESAWSSRLTITSDSRWSSYADE